MSESKTTIYEFGDFRVNAEKRLLTGAGGEAISLTPKVFDTLVYLVEHQGVVLDKEELMHAIWPNTIVEENNLNQSISSLRRVLGESPGQNRYVATVPGRGYQFVASVRKLDPLPALDQGSANQSDDQALPPASSGSRGLLKGLIAGIGIVGVGFLAYYLNSQWMTAPTAPAGFDSTKAESRLTTIAVLPFKPLLAGKTEEPLEMGMADTLIVRLSGLREINVLPISAVRRFGGLEQDPVAAGRELGVESVLDGQIQKLGDRIRVSTRLIRVADGKQIWGDRYEEKLTDIFAMQDLISEKVTSALALKLSSAERTLLRKHHTESAEAYQLYLDGRYYWVNRNEEAVRRAIGYFKKAIEKDPNYALAYAGLADSFSLLGVFHLPPREAYPSAKSAALDALRLDGELAEAHAALGHIKVQYDYDWVGAERHYRKALELNPNYANAHHFYALLLTVLGRFDEGLLEIKRAQELEPSSLFIHSNASGILYQARHYDESINQARRVLEIDPDQTLALNLMGVAYLQKGMHEQAIATLQKAATEANLRHGDLGLAYGLSGRREGALVELARLKELSKRRYVDAYNYALIYIGLGLDEQALDWLEKAYEDRSTRMVWTKVDPLVDRLRSAPRFKALLKQMGLN